MRQDALDDVEKFLYRAGEWSAFPTPTRPVATREAVEVSLQPGEAQAVVYHGRLIWLYLLA
ncbi:MAG: hypothetical protein HY699_18055 [Deltaproteobacteria bacterium]|nr:hypothetical protein [Deltaproteobacteria bacterium]